MQYLPLKIYWKLLQGAFCKELIVQNSSVACLRIFHMVLQSVHVAVIEVYL